MTTIHPMKADRFLYSTNPPHRQYCCFVDEKKVSIYQRYTNVFVDAKPKDWTDDDLLEVIEEWEYMRRWIA